MKVFWSWQNDFEPKVCRLFIREALIAATDLAAEDLGLEDADRPEVDHDTKNTPGMADIAATILEKIAKSAVFVADVTPIGVTAAGKALPNPNVLVELGWAMGKIGPERVICVLNTASGYKADDLPFDIRHRRMMTYGLAPSADKRARLDAKKRLSDELFEALRSNLALHLSDSAAAKAIEGVEASATDPSIWATAGTTLEYADPFEPAIKKSLPFPTRPRAYVRIVPGHWRSHKPNVNEISRLPAELTIRPGGSFDWGFCQEGFVSFSVRLDGESRGQQVVDAVMFFDSTGEFWATIGSIVGDAVRGPSIRQEAVVRYWAQAVKTAFAVFQKFDAAPEWRIELGLVGMDGVRWPGAWADDSPLARKPSFTRRLQLRGWDSVQLLKLLTDAFTDIKDVFALPRATVEDVKKLLPPDWEEVPT